MQVPKSRTQRVLTVLVLLAIIAVVYWEQSVPVPAPRPARIPPTAAPAEIPRSDSEAEREATVAESRLEQAIREHDSDVQVEGAGVVARVLPDDRKGSRHQRFILRLASGNTLLVAHNIDLASRIPNLKVGDHVEFFGEFEWNEEGGVIHWTHHDPAGRHPDGWLKHRGKIYE